jgi:hypothetical protein
MFGKRGLRSVLEKQIVPAVEDHSERWDYVGELVTAKVEEVGGSLVKIGVEAGVSDKFIAGLMTPARPGDRRREQIKRLGRRFGWKQNWLHRALAGLEPEPLPPEELPAQGLEARVSELEAQVRELAASVVDLQKRKIAALTEPPRRAGRSRRADP